MKIILSSPGSPYKSMVDTDVMDVTIREAFIGLALESEDGEVLRVCMRDSGFELAYELPSGQTTSLSLQNGEVRSNTFSNENKHL